MNNEHNLWLTIGLSLSTLPAPSLKWFPFDGDTQMSVSQERLSFHYLRKAVRLQGVRISRLFQRLLLMPALARLLRKSKQFDAHQAERETWLAVGQSLAVFRLNLHS